MTGGDIRERGRKFFGLYMVLVRSLGMYCTGNRTMGKVGICTTYAEMLDTVLDRPFWAFRWYHKARLALHADSKQDPNTAWFFELPELRTLFRVARYDDVIKRAPHCLDCLKASFTEPSQQEGELLCLIASAMLCAGRYHEARDLLSGGIDRLSKIEPSVRAMALLHLAEAEMMAGTSGGATEGMREAHSRLEEAERALNEADRPDPRVPIQLKATRALALIASGRVAEGKALREEALAQAHETIGASHSLTKMLAASCSSS